MKELEDHAWFPVLLRRFQLQFIGSVAVWTHLYRPLVPVLQQLVQQSGSQALQDLCSGSGQPAVYCHQRLAPSLPYTCTDKFPVPETVQAPGITYPQQPVDVLALQPQSTTCYTLFNGFHHFTSVQQQQLVQKMADSGAPFLFAEILQPGPFTLLEILLTTTVGQVLAAPFIKPFSWKRLLFTWVIPVNLFTVSWDGVVSVFKSKTPGRYRQLLTGCSNNGYTITVDSYRHWGGRVTYIQGKLQS